MLRLRCLGLGVLERSFVSSQSKVAEGQQVCSIGVACVEGVEAAGEEEGVLRKAVVEVVVYELSQLGVNR